MYVAAALSFPVLSLLAYAAWKATQWVRNKHSHNSKGPAMRRWARAVLEWLHRPY